MYRTADLPTRATNTVQPKPAAPAAKNHPFVALAMLRGADVEIVQSGILITPHLRKSQSNLSIERRVYHLTVEFERLKRRAEFVRLRKSNVPVKEIARDYGCMPSFVTKELKGAGYGVRQRGPNITSSMDKSIRNMLGRDIEPEIIAGKMGLSVFTIKKYGSRQPTLKPFAHSAR